MVDDNDPFEKKFKMTKNDKLFLEMEQKFTKSLLKSKTVENDLVFLEKF